MLNIARKTNLNYKEPQQNLASWPNWMVGLFNLACRRARALYGGLFVTFSWSYVTTAATTPLEQWGWRGGLATLIWLLLLAMTITLHFLIKEGEKILAARH